MLIIFKNSQFLTFPILKWPTLVAQPKSKILQFPNCPHTFQCGKSQIHPNTCLKIGVVSNVKKNLTSCSPDQTTNSESKNSKFSRVS